jgi:nitroimidazol reductase NimA-like FMN-containing flavoprotein (pyridoxamine 5'-phosphate oxidase superfamily)
MDRNGLEVLDREECLRLLDGVAIGRVAFTSQALPCVLPVNFLRVGDQILFRTGEGTKLAMATRNTVVGFEVDDVDPATQSGWSVLVIGVARRVRDDEARRLGAPTLDRWAPGADGHVVAVTTEVVSGRRIHPAGQRAG